MNRPFTLRFPRRIFFRIILLQSVFVLVALVAAGLFARNLVKANDLLTYDFAFTIFCSFTALVLTAFGVWSGRALMSPLGRLLVRTRNRDNPEPHDDSDAWGKRIDSEWLELESSIDAIKKDLATTLESLSIERAQVSTLMGSISDAILAVRSDGTPLFFNSKFALSFDLDLKRKPRRLWELFRDPAILAGFDSALHDQPAVIEGASIERNGLKRYYSISISPLRGDGGSTPNRSGEGASQGLAMAGANYGAVGIFHDVTELKLAEQMRIDFVANVSHELRTPLTSIKGYVETMVADVEAKRELSGDFLRIIRRNTDRLIQLIGDLLDLSALDANEQAIQKTEIDTFEITQRIRQQFAPAIEAKSLVVSEIFAARTVFADLPRLEQVLVNLLDNAQKYTPAGGALAIRWTHDPNGGVCLEVEDSGPGIALEHHARLFERFYRVDQARSRELGGTGLGLAIVKHIMQWHRGQVEVRSRIGNGSTFVCRFPPDQE